MTTTKWTEDRFEDMLDELIEWFLPCEIEGKNGKMIDINAENYFMNEFLLHKYRIDRHNFSKYLERFPFLKSKVEMIKEIQEFKLAKAGLSKRTDSNLTKFVLGNLHNNHWQDKKVNENTHQVKDFDIKDLIKFRD